MISFRQFLGRFGNFFDKKMSLQNVKSNAVLIKNTMDELKNDVSMVKFSSFKNFYQNIKFIS